MWRRWGRRLFEQMGCGGAGGAAPAPPSWAIPDGSPRPRAHRGAWDLTFNYGRTASPSAMGG